jgi:hypothetical protein
MEFYHWMKDHTGDEEQDEWLKFSSEIENSACWGYLTNQLFDRHICHESIFKTFQLEADDFDREIEEKRDEFQ